MTTANQQRTALEMIRLHGLQARAMAEMHLSEARQQGDATEIERWQDIHAAIGEIRGRAPASPDHPAPGV